MIGPRIGPAIGANMTPAIGAGIDELGAAGLGILIIGDSQIGRGNLTADPTARADPAYNYSAVQSSQFVTLYRRISNPVSDPLVFGITADNVAVQPYTDAAVVYSGPSTGIGQELTRMGIRAAITEYAEVGLACKQMVPSPSPAYPTSGPSWFNLLVTFQRSVEATQNVQTKIIIVSAGNNDGLNSTDSNNLAANMALLYNGLAATWPAAIICWIKINADTVNFPGFIAATITNQTTEFGVLTAIRQIWCDDQIPSYGIEADHAHLTPNGARIYGTRALYQGLDGLGYPRTRPPAAPLMVGDGYNTAADGTCAPTSDGNPMPFDTELLIKLDMLVTNTFSTNSTPSGWTSNSTSNSNSGSGVGCRLSLYTRAIDSTMLSNNHGNTAATSIALDAPCTRLFGKILTYRGSNAGSAPTIVQAVFAGVAGNTSSYTGPSLTTGGANRRVVVITVGFIGSNAQTIVTLTGLTGGATDRNSVVLTPVGGAAGLIDVKSVVVPNASTTINITNVATDHTITSPVTVILELSS